MAFALGLATTLALLGIAASFAGKAYGQIGQGLPLAASALAVVMGLNLLEVLVHLFSILCFLMQLVIWNLIHLSLHIFVPEKMSSRSFVVHSTEGVLQC